MNIFLIVVAPSIKKTSRKTKLIPSFFYLHVGLWPRAEHVILYMYSLKKLLIWFMQQFPD